MPHPRSSGLVGALLATVLAGWAFFAHPTASGGAAMAGMLLLGCASWVGGALLARVNPVAPGVVAAAVVTLALLVTLPESLAGGATAPPLGYANASAALLTIAVAGTLSAAGHADGRLRTALVVWGVVLATASLATGSRAVAVSCLVLVLLWHRLRHGPGLAWQVLAGAVVGLAAVATLLLGMTGTPSAGSDVVTQTVGSTRVDLWADALAIAADHPARGVGPGEFSMHSPTAGSDPDLRWAHSTPLQVLAETGLVGFLLLLALTGWMIVALGRGAVFVAVLGLQSTVDYVLNFPAVIAGSALVLGALMVTGVRRTRPAPGQVIAGSEAD